MPYNGISYYRLKQTDFDGQFSYSRLAMVNFETNPELSFNIYPNPSDGSAINLLINSEIGEKILVVVYDVEGRMNYSKVVITEPMYLLLTYQIGSHRLFI